MLLIYPESDIRNLTLNFTYKDDEGTIIDSDYRDNPPELLDDHLANVIRYEFTPTIEPDSVFITLEFQCNSNTNAFALFNVVADYYIFSVFDAYTNQVLYFTSKKYLAYFVDYEQLFLGQHYKQNAIFEYFPAFLKPLKIVIILFAENTSALQVGLLRAGQLFECQNPKWGFEQGCKDYSIVKQAADGKRFYFPKKRVRTWNGSFQAEVSKKAMYLQQVYNEVGQKPLAWQLGQDYIEPNFATFAYISRCNVQHIAPDFSLVNISLEEVV